MSNILDSNGIRLGNGIITSVDGSGLIGTGYTMSGQWAASQFSPLDNEIYNYTLIQDSIYFQSEGTKDSGDSTVKSDNYTKTTLTGTKIDSVYNVTVETVPNNLFEWTFSFNEYLATTRPVQVEIDLTLPQGVYVFKNINGPSTTYENYYISSMNNASLLFQYKEGEKFKVRCSLQLYNPMSPTFTNGYFRILGKRIA